jgi:hypothetical protein
VFLDHTVVPRLARLRCLSMLSRGQRLASGNPTHGSRGLSTDGRESTGRSQRTLGPRQKLPDHRPICPITGHELRRTHETCAMVTGRIKFAREVRETMRRTRRRTAPIEAARSRATRLTTRRA